MNKELDNKLVEDFPLLYIDRHGDINNSCMPFGFECCDGWEPLIRELSSKLEPLIQKWIDENPENKNFHPRASQVKEKFGGLRFYMDHATDAMFDLIEKAEEKSEIICEICGCDGTLVSINGYITCVCSKCHEKILEDGRTRWVNQ